MDQNKPKIKLAIITCSLSYGGAERLILDIIKKLDQDLFQIHLITVMGGGELLPEFAKLPLAIKICHKKSKLGLGVIWEIKKYLQKQQIEIVHTHLFAGDTWGAIAAYLALVPVIISTKHSLKLENEGLKKICKIIVNRFNQKIIAVSAEVKNYLINEEKISPAKISVITNGINLARFPYQTSYQPQQPIRLGVMGRLAPEKGQTIALKAAAWLINSGLQIKLKIKGQGQDQAGLIKMAGQLNLAESIVWEEASLEVNNFYQNIDLLLIPSLIEGFSLTALEAMASGVPIIASATGGLKEIIKDGYNGWLFPAGDYLALAEKIKTIIKDTPTIEMVRKNARTTVENNFDLKTTVQQYQDLYLKT